MSVLRDLTVTAGGLVPQRARAASGSLSISSAAEYAREISSYVLSTKTIISWAADICPVYKKFAMLCLVR